MRIPLRRVFGVGALALWLASPTAAQPQYRVDSWTTANGLPQNSVHAVVQTRGKGFVPHGSGEARGFGLIGIAERARLFGGEQQIHSASGQGTTIHMTLHVHATHATNGTGHGA